MNRRLKPSVIIITIVALTGCEKTTPTPVPPPAASPQPAASADDSKAIAEFLNKDKTSKPMAGLPANHPPIDGGMAPMPAATPGTLPPGHPPIESPGGAGGPPTPDMDAVLYTAPREWVPQAATSQMRKAQFLIPRAEGDTEDGQMVVFYFGAGQGGAVEANIDRWKGMFSTAEGKPVPDSDVKRETHEVNGMKVTTLDVAGRYVDAMSGRHGPASGENAAEFRMLSAIVETPQGPWFFKGVGPVATMKAQEQNFKDFVASFKGRP